MSNQKLNQLFDQNRPQTHMSEEEMMIFMHLLMSKDQNLHTDVSQLDKESDIYKHFKPIIDGFQMQVFLKRLENMAKLRISLGAFIAIAQYLNSAGDAVMYAYYLRMKMPENGFITLEKISMDLFPWGFFSEEQLHAIWNGQKITKENRDEVKNMDCYGAPDNLIDYIQAWEN